MRRIFLTLLAVLLSLPLTASASERPPRPAVGGELIYTLWSVPDSLAYPYTTNADTREITRQIFGPGLLRYSPENKVEPAFARAMPRVSDDQLTYRFQLHRDVRFHDGAELTAHDFKFTYDLYRDPAFTGYRPPGAELIDTIVVHDLYSLSITLSEPSVTFMSLGILFEPPLPRHLLRRTELAKVAEADFWNKPVGAGPFRFAAWAPGQYVYLQRNPIYWEAKVNPAVGPWLEEVLILPADDEQASMAMAQGTISFLNPMIEEVVDFFVTEGQEVLAFHEWLRMGYGLVRLHGDKYPTNLPEVRWALAHAIDREQLINDRFDGHADLMHGLMPQAHPAHNPDLAGFDYDLDKVTDLLAAVGYAKGPDGFYQNNGEPLTIYLAATEYNVAAYLIVQQWRAAGIDAYYLAFTFEDLANEVIPSGEYHATFMGQNVPLEPAATLSGFHSSQIQLDDAGWNRGPNRSYYQSEAVDGLLDLAEQTADAAERLALLQEAEALIMADMPIIPLYQNRYTSAVWQSYQGVVVVPGYGYGFFERWYLYEENK